MTAVLIVVGVIVLLAAIFVPLGVLLARRSRRLQAGLAAEVAGAEVLIAPERAVYRGGTGRFPKVVGNGLIALTGERLMFRILIGTSVDLDVAEITDVREQKVFRRSVVGGRTHLVIATARGDVAFFVPDNAAWIAALRTARA